MKKVNLFLIGLITLLTLSVGFSSCSKDDDKDDKKGIVGLWKFSEIIADIENPENPELAEMEKTMFQISAMFLHATTIEFKADNTFIFSVTVMGFNQTETGTYSYDGNNLTMKSDEGEESELDDLSKGTITLKNGVLTFEADGLDEIDEKTGQTYREAGFTKYYTKMTFKK